MKLFKRNPPANRLWQIVPNFKGTNAEYFRREELNKCLITGNYGARFTIAPMSQKATIERENNVELFERADDSFTDFQLGRIIKKYGGYYIPVNPAGKLSKQEMKV